MKLLVSSGFKRTLVAFAILVIIVGAGVWAQSMPWELERQLLLVTGVAAGLFLITTLSLLGSSHTESSNVSTLVAEQELFAELYKNSPVPYIRTDNIGRIIDINMAGVRLFGETAEVMVSRNLFETFIGDVNVTEHIARIPQLVGAGSFINDQEVQMKRADGAVRWVMLSAFPYAGRKESLVTLVDITKQKNIENAKSEFVSLASHQLRTPISSIKWNMELLMSPMIGTLNEKQKEYAEKIARGADRMAVLIRDFLNASRLEMGTFKPEFQSITLGSFIDEQIEENDSRIAAKEIELNSNFEPRELSLTVDTHLLRMVLSNLISNAIKYTPAGHSVTIAYREVAGSVELEVSDTGIGIPEADQSSLFAKFFRASNTRDSAIEGTGIGLYIVHQAIKRMGGTLSFGSKEGVGTRFVVNIPLQGQTRNV